MNRLQAFEQLLERVQNRDTLVKHNYKVVQEDGKECYCAVGHLMNICGADMELFINGGRVNNVPIDDFVMEGHPTVTPLLEIGITGYELEELQNLNDEESFDELEEFIKNTIEEERVG